MADRRPRDTAPGGGHNALSTRSYPRRSTTPKQAMVARYGARGTTANKVARCHDGRGWLVRCGGSRSDAQRFLPERGVASGSVPIARFRA
jgi:hypothetical protein